MYRIDLEDSKDDGIVLVKLSGRAQAETIVKLLDELNALAEREPAVRVLIDETELGAGLVGPSDIGRIAQAWRKAGALRSVRIAAFASNPVIYGQPNVSGSRGRSRAGERLQRPRASEGLAP